MDVNEIDDAALDRLLDKVPAPAASPALERRILADFHRVQSRWSFAKAARRFGDAVWPDKPNKQPTKTNTKTHQNNHNNTTKTPNNNAQQDDASANVFALDGSPDVDAGQGI